MSTEYTPTTEDVREVATTADWCLSDRRNAAAFDRWLAEHDREKDARIESLEAELKRRHSEAATQHLRADKAEGRADRAEARLARVTGDALMIEHTIIGTQAGKQGAGQTVPEDFVVCAKCGWMRGSDYVLHLADAIRVVVADEQSRPTRPRNPATGSHTIRTRKTARNGGAGFAADEQEQPNEASPGKISSPKA